MEQLGAQIAAHAEQPLSIFLSGDLAAGKTTFARGFIRSRGHLGAVKSPTFTLVESYQFDQRWIHHFDLYRLEDAEELEYIGLDEYFIDSADCLVEWPEKGYGALPNADLNIDISVRRTVRDVQIKANTEQGSKILNNLESKYVNS
jgi:tRNA threonylcarbamoyladenosine biosynthesis protein TsaE